MKEYSNDILIEKILSKTATEAEILAFNSWLSKKESNKKHFEQSKIVWEKLNDVYKNTHFDKAEAKEKIIQKINKQANGKIIKLKTNTLKYWILAAASIILLMGVFSIWNSNQILTSYTSENEVREILLPDSTAVWLNKNTTLQITKGFNKNKRKVKLIGEAFFEVKRNEQKPFKIYTGNTVTEVLGTSFNINQTIQQIELIVTSGKVGFYEKKSLKNERILLGEDIAIYDNLKKRITYSTNKNRNYLSWQNGILDFYETPLSDVCKQLNKHFGENIKMVKSLQHISLTGRFENENLYDILKTIEITLDVKIHKTHDNGLLIIPIKQKA